MSKVLLDTDILSEVLKGKSAVVTARAAAYLAQQGCFTTSAVSVAEIVYGFRRVGREDRVAQFEASLDAAEVLPLDEASARLAGRINADLERVGRIIGMPDVMIAAEKRITDRLKARRELALLAEAEAELEDAATWYDDRSEGLGDEFVSVAREAVLLVAESPDSWPLWPGAPARIPPVSLSGNHSIVYSGTIRDREIPDASQRCYLANTQPSEVP